MGYKSEWKVKEAQAFTPPTCKARSPVLLVLSLLHPSGRAQPMGFHRHSSGGCTPPETRWKIRGLCSFFWGEKSLHFSKRFMTKIIFAYYISNTLYTPTWKMVCSLILQFCAWYTCHIIYTQKRISWINECINKWKNKCSSPIWE